MSGQGPYANCQGQASQGLQQQIAQYGYGSPEPYANESALARAKRRLTEVHMDLARIDGLREEKAMLERMIAAAETKP